MALLDQNGVDFLFAELQAGLTFARIATAKRSSPEKRTRNTSNARKAYDSILHFRERVALSNAETTKLKHGMNELKKALQGLGETV
jgi:hypothetical protein